MTAPARTPADLLAIPAAELLAIPPDEPERLFSEAELREQYQRLVEHWHPDVNPDQQAGAVLAHLSELVRHAQAKAAAGLWAKPHRRILVATDGKRGALQSAPSKVLAQQARRCIDQASSMSSAED